MVAAFDHAGDAIPAFSPIQMIRVTMSSVPPIMLYAKAFPSSWFSAAFHGAWFVFIDKLPAQLIRSPLASVMHPAQAVGCNIGLVAAFYFTVKAHSHLPLEAP